ncbi:reverse transcriptase domain-containing protein [Mesorhizobium sp. ISC11]|uniref:reverse transcriptase domain-containing protein n=1 Tax=Mesorhizobium sp. ISC11 TaxID=3076428 RepID=UPI00301E3685
MSATLAGQVLCDGVAFPLTELGAEHEDEALLEYAICSKRERKLHKQLRSAPTESAFRKKAEVYFASIACRFVSMVEQAKRLPRWKRLPISTCLDLSKKLSLSQPITEPVACWHEPKASGQGFRLLHDFGPLHRAAQHMVLRVISARWEPKPFQYGVRKRGQADAVELIRKLILSGYHHGMTLDLRDFFNSFSRDALTTLLPLPKSIITNVVIPDNLKLKPKKGGTQATCNAPGCASNSYTYPIPSPTVLPQGSACSNIVAAYVVSALDIVVPAGVVLTMYVDDICLLAKNADDLKLAENALLLAFEESAAGDFTFHLSEDTLDDGGLRFLGYYLWFVPGTKNLLVSPTYEAKNMHKKECTLRERRVAYIAKINKAIVAEAIADYCLYRVAWAIAFRAADHFPLMLEQAIERFVKLCLKHDVPVAYAKKLVGGAFVHEIVKTPKKSGGYSEKIKIAHLATALLAVPGP